MRSNVAGARTDVAWKTHQNVSACTMVPEDVKVKIQNILEQNELNSRKRKGVFTIEEVEQPFKRGKLASMDTSEISKTKEKVFAVLDDFVEKIGEEHVVSDCEMLMDKRKKLFWTPCAAHCIDLMFVERVSKWKEKSSVGDDTPELKQFAIRVHSKGRNRLQQQKMNDLVYVMYNLKLSGREERKRKEEDFETFNFEDVDSDDEWITKDNEDLTNVYENEPTTHGDSRDDDFLEKAIRNQYGWEMDSLEE
ncbi:zf-BED domain-containing protein [Tanacetum coccineum]